MRPASLRSTIGQRAAGLPVVGMMAVAAAGAQAQSTDPAQSAAAEAPIAGRSFSIVPNVSIAETLTDNGRLNNSDRQSDLITQLTAGLHVQSLGGRVRGFLDYSLIGLAYAKSSQANEIQNALNASARAEAIENWAYVDVAANVSQRAISAFGTQSIDPTLVNNNRTEVSTYTLSPYVHGQVLGVADYEARLTQAATHSDASGVSDVTNSGGSLRLNSGSTRGRLNWSAEGSRQVYDYHAGRKTEDDRLRAALGFTIDPQFQVSVIGGHESNNFVSFNKEGHTTSGAEIDWTPTERTTLSASGERRFFGHSHSLAFGHRTPRTVWSYNDTRDVSTSFGQAPLGSRGTIYDLLYAQLASVQPDPVLRAQLVTAFLQANGIPPGAVLPTGSLTSAVTLERRQALSFALMGIRNTATLTALQSEARRLDSITSANDDFSNGNLVRQRALNVNLAHRLTPLSALNVTATVARTSGAAASPVTHLNTLGLNWTSQLGPRSNLMLGARHASFKSSIQPYTESALTAQLSFRM